MEISELLDNNIRIMLKYMCKFLLIVFCACVTMILLI